MKVGDIVHTKSFKATFPRPKKETGITSMTLKAPKGRAFAMLVLGDVPEDGSQPIDANKFLMDLGWKPPK
jgi:hypothetical protein